MSSLVNIAKGWMNVITHHNSEMAMQRLAVCDGCSYKLQVSDVGTRIISVINNEASVYYCGKCGCPLAAKVTVAAEQCPENLWPIEQSFY